MRIGHLALFLTAAGACAAAWAASPSHFVKGRTTVAEVEQGLGAPTDTTMQADGGLTLFYPSDRLVGRAGTARTVALQFGPDFVYRNIVVVSESRIMVNGYASR
jgi:hypothetical protein